MTMCKSLAVFGVLTFTLAASANAQTATQACAQGSATVRTGNAAGELTAPNAAKNQTLSEHLAKSGGVICPPAGIDSEIKAPTPEGGRIQVIPPPGTPQNQPHVQPK